MLQYQFNWKMLSAIAGVRWWNFYFRLFPGAIRSPQIIEFLSHLLRHIPGKLLIVWHGLPGHRSRAVRDLVQQRRARLWLEFLPAYAELNPVEYLWSHWKARVTELPPQNVRGTESLCPKGAASYAAATHSGGRVLAAGKPVPAVTLLCNCVEARALCKPRPARTPCSRIECPPALLLCWLAAGPLLRRN